MAVKDNAPLSKLFPRTFHQPLVSFDQTGQGSTLKSKPLRVGIVFCGRQSPGGHNVVSGVYDFLKGLHPDSKVLGFIGGTLGFFQQNYIEVTDEILALYRNQGGYDMLGRSVDKIYSQDHVIATKKTCLDLSLDGLVLVGSHGTASYAAHLAELLVQSGVETRVIVTPGSIDGDMKNQFIEAAFGFDTACKVYSELIGNIATDGCSSRKYYYFIRLMGRGASHIALECALQTHPDVVLLGEEVAGNKLSLVDIVNQLADVVCARSDSQKNFGVVLLPEGLVAAIPEMATLIQEINGAISGEGSDSVEGVLARLTPWSRALYSFLPSFIQTQLLLERESSGSVQLTQIETERLLAFLLDAELASRKAAGRFSGKFAAITHFFGYQARCSPPSNFDCAYAHNLGRAAAALAAGGYSGYMASVRNLKAPFSDWRAGGVPLTAMMKLAGRVAATSSVAAVEEKQGSEAGSGPAERGLPAFVAPAGVDLQGSAYKALQRAAAEWVLNDTYRNPGPIQFSGPTADDRTITLQLEKHDYLGQIQQLQALLDAARDACRPGCPQPVLSVALEGMRSLTNILSIMQADSADTSPGN